MAFPLKSGSKAKGRKARGPGKERGNVRMVTLRLTLEERDLLKRRARGNGYSVNGFIRYLVGLPVFMDDENEDEAR